MGLIEHKRHAEHNVRFNICERGVPQVRMHNGTDAIFEKITTENFPKLMEDLNLQIYIAQAEIKKKLK